jgi:hypothetical protein
MSLLPMLIARRYLCTLTIVVAVAALITSYIDRSCRSEPLHSDPQKMEEVIAITQKQGLHYRSDQEDGTLTMRLTVSESPITWEHANALKLDPRKKSAWNGTMVIFYRDWDGLQTMPHDQFEVWGEFLLYGDPSLIKRLTATATSEESAGN